MQNNKFNENLTGTFSMRKIPVVVKNKDKDILNDDNIDKIKILELSNIIDKWEQEILFSDKGFFSLKGKDVENKTKDFILELENLISSKISEISFSNPFSREIAAKIKKDKISAIKREMLSYEQLQLKNWETEVYENAVSSSITRAILYKSNPDITAASLKNGLAVLKVMAEKEKWTDKTYKQKSADYKSRFFSSVINSFIQDKDVNAFIYFNKYKNLLQIKEKEKLEEAVKLLKVNTVAYNWAKELFSYHISNEEQESEIKKIKDDEIETLVRKFLNDFSKSEKKQIKEKEEKKNKQNWEEINNVIKDDVDKAYLYIDYSLNKDNIKHKKDYIKQIQQNGFITTDKKQFVNLLAEFFDDFEKFKIKDISDYQYCLSKEDYDLFLNYQKSEEKNFHKLLFDYKYVAKKLKEAEIKKDEDVYDFIKLLLLSKEEYKSVNKKDADLDNRNKLIDLILERYKEENKERKK